MTVANPNVETIIDPIERLENFMREFMANPDAFARGKRGQVEALDYRLQNSSLLRRGAAHFLIQEFSGRDHSVIADNGHGASVSPLKPTPDGADHSASASNGNSADAAPQEPHRGEGDHFASAANNGHDAYVSPPRPNGPSASFIAAQLEAKMKNADTIKYMLPDGTDIRKVKAKELPHYHAEGMRMAVNGMRMTAIVYRIMNSARNVDPESRVIDFIKPGALDQIIAAAEYDLRNPHGVR